MAAGESDEVGLVGTVPSLWGDGPSVLTDGVGGVAVATGSVLGVSKMA